MWGAGCRERLATWRDARTAALWVDEHFVASTSSRPRDQLGRALSSRPSSPACRGLGTSTPLSRLAPGKWTWSVAVGGGSAIDAAKAVMAGALYGTYDGVGMGELRGLEVLPGRPAPLLLCVPTTAGTGAEVSRYYVTYDCATRAKVHGKSWRLLADWVLLDPFVLRDSPRSCWSGARSMPSSTFGSPSSAGKSARGSTRC